MEFLIQAHPLFIAQLDELSPGSKRLIENKILLIKSNPFRNKRIHGYHLLLFRIRFEDDRKEKRLIYLVDMSEIASSAHLNAST
jgi:mRNA-degrading endonuclease RelE of RelBE toxin-antitoxin system